MQNRFLFLLLLCFFPAAVFSQKKYITLDDIYKKGTFRPDAVTMRFDNSTPELPEIKPENITGINGKPLTRLESVEPTHRPDIFIIRQSVTPIYRHSTKAYVYVHNTTTGKTVIADTGKVMHPDISPDGSQLSFVKDNNLYLKNLSTGTVTAVTTDGKWNYVINGNCDWVYEEEFSFTKAYFWSPKGNYLAYYRFNEEKVKEYNMTIYNDDHNIDYRYKYPKAGDDNSVVDIFIYNVATQTKVAANYEQGDIYIPRIKWTPDDNTLLVFWMNRHQNNLKLLLTNATNGSSKLMYEEKDKYYIDINDDLEFLPDGKHFVFTSEKDGYNHIYLYSTDGKTKTQISAGNYDVTAINAVDMNKKQIIYTKAFPRPMDRNAFITDFTGKKTYPLTTGEKFHNITLNNDNTEFFDRASDINTPPTVTRNTIQYLANKIDVKTDKTISESEKLKAAINEYVTSKAEFLRIPNTKGDTLNSWMLKPADFDPAKKYPVLFCNYGGPGSQQVGNRFGAVSFWHQLMAQQGFIIVSVDNTGTGYRGAEFKKKTYLQLGKFEIEDQIDAATYLGKMPFVDKDNIGHWGWSFGGFMSSLAITKGADVFSAAVAVAPVTSWRYYDNIYTERFMRTPQENPKGYDDNSPVNFTQNIKGKYLIIHGTADDNVHFQNATQMITAMVKNNVDFESAYYPNKNHSINGTPDNTSYHLWSKMTHWIIDNMGNKNTKPLPAVKATGPKPF